MLTILRKYGLGRVLPVDHHTSFHKTCGVATFALAALHAAMHLANIALNLAQDNFGAFVEENGMEVGLQGDTSLWSKPPIYKFTPKQRLRFCTWASY